MTIEQANEYFSSLPEGFAPAEELRAALTADVQKVQFVGVAGTAGKTAACWSAAVRPSPSRRKSCWRTAERHRSLKNNPKDLYTEKVYRSFLYARKKEMRIWRQ